MTPMLNAHGDDEQLAGTELDVTIRERIVTRPDRTREQSSASWWLCHTNSPFTFTTSHHGH